MLGLGFSADFAFAGAPCEFLLNSAEGSRVDNGRVAVFYIVFRAFAVVDSDLFADAVGDVGEWTVSWKTAILLFPSGF